MIVLVDTSVWSLALRRRRKQAADRAILEELTELIREVRTSIIGPIRQEILSGIQAASHFDVLRSYLRAFDDTPVETAEYEQAAVLGNVCRERGLQGSSTDFLICAVAQRHGMSIFTTDRDFSRYAQHIDITLHAPRRSGEKEE